MQMYMQPPTDSMDVNANHSHCQHYKLQPHLPHQLAAFDLTVERRPPVPGHRKALPVSVKRRKLDMDLSLASCGLTGLLSSLFNRQ